MALKMLQELFPRDHALAARAKDPNEASNSLSGLLATLIPVLIVSAIMFLAFMILRRTQKRQYSPRTYLGTIRKEERTPELPNGLFNWIGAFMKIPDTHVLNTQSLDGYLLLRYLKIATTTCFVGCLITWPVLFPVNATGGAGNQQLDILNMSNVTDKYRYYAHCGISYIFFGFVMYMITRESLFYINLRQAYLISPLFANRISSRTVLFASVPDAFLDETVIRRIFGPALKNLWISTDCKKVDELVQERDSVALKLEAAESKLVTTANANHIKGKKGKKGVAQHDEEAAPAAVTSSTDHANGESGSAAAAHLGPKDRPTHRLKPLIGKKVDTIDWSRSELQRLIPLVEAEQAAHRSGEGKRQPAVFVEFHTQNEAQAAYQSLTHHQPLHMSPRYIGINPEDIIWSNLRIKWWERVVRGLISTAFISALIIFWAIPVAFVGIVSNINFLANKVPFLGWILDIPPVVLGVVTSLLPVVLLAVLMSLVPPILRLAAKFAGAPGRAQVELSLQSSYFAFQVVQVFLVVTLSSAATSVVTKIINDPTSATSLLATNLPKASNFYIAYFVLQGLAISAKSLLRIVPLLLHTILGKLLDKTPRKVYKRYSGLADVKWGSVFPPFTLLLVIAITYSCIAPLVLGFATIGFYLLYLAFRYNLIFVDHATIDTKGLVYPRALGQTMVGIYLAEICLIGLFAIAQTPGPIVLEVILLVFTALYHMQLNAALGPMLRNLPKSLATEEEALLSLESGHAGAMAAHEKHNGTEPGTSGTVLKEDANAALAPQKKPNLFSKWLRPDRFTDYHTLRRLVPKDWSHITYSEVTERDAYYDPAIASPTPQLWIPRDPLGVSRQEVAHTSKVTPITDEGATLDEKNKIAMDQTASPPIHQERKYL